MAVGPVSRLVGLDVARCLALLGMVATHVVAGRDAAGEVTTLHEVAGGRASALFAVLLGVTMGLTSGGARPHRGRVLARDALALAVRAVLVAAVGLALGGLETSIAIILTYYGVVLLLALPFLGLGARPLLVLGSAWAVLGPVVSHVLRPSLPPRRFDSPALEQLAEPAHLLSELLFTGYYPAFAWLAYALVGMGLGRLDLPHAGTAALLTVVGSLVAVGSVVLSGLATTLTGFDPRVLDEISTGMFGQTPTEEWRWLLVVAPHSTTPFDLLHTGGTAVAVIGLCLLVLGALRALVPPAERAVAVLLGAGTATLSLYALHVVMRTEAVWPAEEAVTLRWHWLVLLWIGALLVATGRRGPLEWLLGWLPRRIRG